MSFFDIFSIPPSMQQLPQLKFEVRADSPLEGKKFKLVLSTPFSVNPSLDQKIFENRGDDPSGNGHVRPWGHGCCLDEVGKQLFPVISVLWGCRDLDDNQIVSTRIPCGLRITELMRFLSASLWTAMTVALVVRFYFQKKALNKRLRAKVLRLQDDLLNEFLVRRREHEECVP